MAFCCHRFFTRLTITTRYHFPQLLSCPSSTLNSHFSSLDLMHRPGGGIENQSKKLDEKHVLDELSSILPISHKTKTFPSPLNAKNGVFEMGTGVDHLLLPEERLRGVFLQKLTGISAIECALSSVDVDLSLDLVGKVLNRGNLGGESMVIFFNWAVKQPMIPNNIHSFNVLIKALGRRKFIAFLVQVVQDLRTKGMNPNLETVSILMDSLIRARRVYKAVQILGNSQEFGFECSTESLNVLLQCLCRRSHVGAANSCFNSVKGKVKFNVMTYNIVIGGWAKYGRVSEIERIVEAMGKDGFNPDCLTFRYLLEGLGRAHRMEHAVKVFQNMKESGCARDAGVYNSMISNFISIGDFDECIKLYEGMMRDNCDPNIETYTNLISAFIKARKVADALEMFDEMLNRGMVPTTGTITSFIEPLCHFGPPHAAMVIYKKARKAGCKTSLKAYKLLLMRLSRFGKCGMLLNVWHDMQRSGYTSDIEVYEYIINGLCNNGQLESAICVMEESLRKGFCPSKLICSKLNTKLIASNKVDKAYRLFLEIRVARRKENSWRNSRAKGWPF
ncbi:hypothetical protein K2173_016796 [Erythroxylum novogranatense]|uniref:Pentatricopeptide repeat-containing protein n=1 Tax=Erythroxylum novogranatense TaxID=1862640 RepID=A0AAV8SHC8_9ROSI|nr:hypothetical protein K2173_016796 [Erythroxylum novogranatense]